MSPNKVSKPLLYALAVLVLVALVKGLFIPVLQWRSDQIEKLQRQKKSWARMVNLSHQDASLSQANQSYKKKLTELGEYCFSAPSGAEKIQLEIQQIVERQATKAGVEILSVKWIKSIADDGTVMKVAVKVHCQGITSAIAALVVAIETHKPLLKIDQFTLAAPQKAKKLKATFVMVGLGVQK